jgi:hypothetical protein
LSFTNSPWLTAKNLLKLFILGRNFHNKNSQYNCIVMQYKIVTKEQSRCEIFSSYSPKINEPPGLTQPNSAQPSYFKYSVPYLQNKIQYSTVTVILYSTEHWTPETGVQCSFLQCTVHLFKFCFYFKLNSNNSKNKANF